MAKREYSLENTRNIGIMAHSDAGKTTLAVSVGKNAQARGLKAGLLAKQIAAIAGGNGGVHAAARGTRLRQITLVQKRQRAVHI